MQTQKKSDLHKITNIKDKRGVRYIMTCTDVMSVYVIIYRALFVKNNIEVYTVGQDLT